MPSFTSEYIARTRSTSARSTMASKSASTSKPYHFRTITRAREAVHLRSWLGRADRMQVPDAQKPTGVSLRLSAIRQRSPDNRRQWRSGGQIANDQISLHGTFVFLLRCGANSPKIDRSPTARSSADGARGPEVATRRGEAFQRVPYGDSEAHMSCCCKGAMIQTGRQINLGAKPAPIIGRLEWRSSDWCFAC